MLCHGWGGGQKANNSRAGLHWGDKEARQLRDTQRDRHKGKPLLASKPAGRGRCSVGQQVSSETGHEDGLREGLASRERTCLLRTQRQWGVLTAPPGMLCSSGRPGLLPGPTRPILVPWSFPSASGSHLTALASLLGVVTPTYGATDQTPQAPAAVLPSTLQDDRSVFRDGDTVTASRQEPLMARAPRSRHTVPARARDPS